MVISIQCFRRLAYCLDANLPARRPAIVALCFAPAKCRPINYCNAFLAAEWARKRSNNRILATNHSLRRARRIARFDGFLLAHVQSSGVVRARCVGFCQLIGTAIQLSLDIHPPGNEEHTYGDLPPDCAPNNRQPSEIRKRSKRNFHFPCHGLFPFAMVFRIRRQNNRRHGTLVYSRPVRIRVGRMPTRADIRPGDATPSLHLRPREPSDPPCASPATSATLPAS